MGREIGLLSATLLEVSCNLPPTGSGGSYYFLPAHSTLYIIKNSLLVSKSKGFHDFLVGSP